MGAALWLAGCGGGGSSGGGSGVPVTQIPKAVFTVQAKSVAGVTVALTGDTFTFDPSQSEVLPAGSGAIVKYVWDFHYDGLTVNPEAFTSQGDAVNYAYTSPGHYIVALQVTDDQGATDIVTAPVDVGDSDPSKTLQPIPTSVDFGTPVVGEAVQGTVYVYSRANKTVYITGVTSNQAEVKPGALPPSLPVMPQEAVPIPVTFTSFGTTSVVGTLSIEIDGASTLVVTFGGTARSGFAPVGSMTVARRFHTATRLQDGRVLIVGGEDASNQILDSAEIYDPATHSFSPAPPMSSVLSHDPLLPAVFGRSHHTATLLADGTVLVAGGEYFDGTNRQVHASGMVFNPATEQWEYDFRIDPRTQHVAVRVVTGGIEKIALVGGKASIATAGGLDTVEILLANGNSVATGTLLEPRVQHAAVALDDHRVLIAGGIGGVDGATDGAEIFDINQPAQPSMPLTLDVARYDLSLTAVASGSGTHWLAVGGGQVGIRAWGVVEAYQDGSGTFVLPAARLSVPRRRHVAVDLGGDRGLLVVGGVGSDNLPVGVAEIIAPDGGSATTLAERMNLARGNGFRATLLQDGSVLITGGVAQGPGNSAVKAAELYVPVPAP